MHPGYERLNVLARLWSDVNPLTKELRMSDSHCQFMKPLSTLFLILTLVFPGCTESDPQQEKAISEADIDAYIDTLSPYFPGLAAAVVVQDKVVWSKGYGVADLDSGRPVTADTPFKLASVTKTVVATAIMQAVEKEILSLDITIEDIGLPFSVDNPHLSGETVRLKDLVTHSSGILDNAAYNCAYYVEDQNNVCLETLFDPDSECQNPAVTGLFDFLGHYLSPGGIYYSLENYSRTMAPGSGHEYSNVGTALAAACFEILTGSDLKAHCQTSIFTPLGMLNTCWDHHACPPNNPPAEPYTYLDGDFIQLPMYSLATWPDGGLYSSANDLGRFLAAIINNGQLDGKRILNADTVAAMINSQPDSPPDNISQGVFWYLDENGLIGHSGGDPGVSTSMLFDPVTGYGVILLFNFDFFEIPIEVEGNLLWIPALRDKLMKFAESFQE